MPDSDGDGSLPLYRYRFGTSEFDESSFELIVSGKVASLQRKPLEVLAVLLRHAGEIVTREELKKQVWDGRETVEHVINNAVTKLRTALGPDAGMIFTLPRVGYRFKGDFQRTALRYAVGSGLSLERGQAVPGRVQFQLESMLGRSVQHEVWLARDAQTGERRVYKFCVEGARVAGLKREATLARLLRDTLGPREDLVHLIAWNFEEAPYFLESEYGGVNLREWAEDGDQLATLGVDDRLGLFLQIADAVAAAHNVGVIHKDLKPSNLLISSTSTGWRLRVADFGSGRLLNPERLAELGLSKLSFTLTERRAADAAGGTLLYMAPELLADAPATVQSDVYALGLILYQLVAGDLTRPLAPGWDREIGDALLRADIARATDVDPMLRTSSALQLAQQLRDLASRREERVRQERADTERTLLLEGRRRSQARAPWVRATFAILLAGVAISGALYWRATSSARKLEAQIGIVARLYVILTGDLTTAANPDRAVRTDATVADATTAAAGRIDQDLPEGPYDVRATLHSAMQQAFSGLSDYPSAISQGQQSLRDLAAAGRTATPELLLPVQLQLVYDFAQSSRFADAQVTLQQAQSLIQADTPVALRARNAYVTGVLYSRQLQLDKAAAAFQSALTLAETARPEPDDLIDGIELSLGDTLTMTGRYAEGEQMLRRLLEQELRQDGAQSARAELTRVSLASNLGYQRRFDEAETLANHALVHFTELFGAYHRRTFQAMYSLASLYFEQERYIEAATLYGELHDRVEHRSGPRQVYAVSTASNQGEALHRAGRTADGASVLRAELQVARSFLADDSPRVQVLRYRLADCELDLRHATDEVAALLNGLDPAVLQTAEQETDWDGRLAYEQGRLALVRGDRDGARGLLTRALQIITERDPDGPITPKSIRLLIDGLKQNSAKPCRGRTCVAPVSSDATTRQPLPQTFLRTGPPIRRRSTRG